MAAQQRVQATVSLDPENKQLLKRVAVALEVSNKKSTVVVCNHKIKPSPHALDIVIDVLRTTNGEDDEVIRGLITEMFRRGVLFVLDPDYNDNYSITPGASTLEGETSPT